MLSCTNQTSPVLPQNKQPESISSQLKLDGSAAEFKVRKLSDDELEAVAGGFDPEWEPLSA